MSFKITHILSRQAIWGVSSLLIVGCSSSKPPERDAGTGLHEDGGAVASRADVLEAAGRCALRNAKSFQTVAGELAATPNQENWKRAMSAWQRLEVLQFGPTGSSTKPGGLDIRDHVYAWPLFSRCATEDVMVSKQYENGVSRLLVNRRGLTALEYVLFYAGDDVSCSAAAWTALTPAERTARKQAFAAALAADVKVQADALVAAWEGGFIDTMKTAGPGNRTYMTTAGAMNRVSDAMYYVEKEVKDVKLAVPMGLRDCAAAPCLETLESQYAHHNTANVRANLVAFRQLLEGCDDDAYAGIGFDEALVAANAGDLANRMRTNLIAAEAALDAIEEDDLSVALVNDPASVRAFYDAVKSVTDLLKSEFVTVLDLEPPMGLEGDND